MSTYFKNGRTEEIRALFILGLLAVLASVRTQTINAPTENGPFPLNPIIDITLLFMSLYALFMVFGYSGDLIGKTASLAFKKMAIQFVILNFIVLIFYGFIYAIEFYQSRFMYMLILLAIPALYCATLRVKEFRRKKSWENKTKLTIEEKLVLFIQTSSGFGVAFMAMLISYYGPEKFLPEFTAIGCFLVIIWLYFMSLNKSKHIPEQPNNDPI